MKRVPTRMTVLSVTAAIASVLVFCPRADAQITVPVSTFPAPGDTLKLAIDNAPGACAVATYTPPGGNQLWNLSCLNVGATQDIVYRPASEGSVTVPGATMFAVVPPSVFPGTSPLTEEGPTTSSAVVFSCWPATANTSISAPIRSSICFRLCLSATRR